MNDPREPSSTEQPPAAHSHAPRASTSSAPASTATRLLLRILAVVSLALGLLGVVLPGLPTTPFVLLAAWAAARSSPRLLAWLEAHRLFGPMIKDWQAGGRVSRRAKWSATVAMLVCAVLMWWVSPVRWAALAGIGTMLVVGIWLWRRPEPESARGAAQSRQYSDDSD